VIPQPQRGDGPAALNRRLGGTHVTGQCRSGGLQVLRREGETEEAGGFGRLRGSRGLGGPDQFDDHVAGPEEHLAHGLAVAGAEPLATQLQAGARQGLDGSVDVGRCDHQVIDGADAVRVDRRGPRRRILGAPAGAEAVEIGDAGLPMSMSGVTPKVPAQHAPGPVVAVQANPYPADGDRAVGDLEADGRPRAGPIADVQRDESR